MANHRLALGPARILCEGWRTTGGFPSVLLLMAVFMPGFVRGPAFHNNHAMVGLSLPRDGSFAGLQLDEELKKRDADPWCGVQIVNLSSGDVVEWIRFETAISELLDVCALPGVRLPSATAPSDPNIAKLYTIDPGREGA